MRKYFLDGLFMMNDHRVSIDHNHYHHRHPPEHSPHPCLMTTAHYSTITTTLVLDLKLLLRVFFRFSSFSIPSLLIFFISLDNLHKPLLFIILNNNRNLFLLFSSSRIRLRKRGEKVIWPTLG